MGEIMVEITISNEVKQEFEDLTLGIALIKNIQIKRSDERLKAKIRKVQEKIRKQIKIGDLKNMPLIKAYRKFYWKIKIDPTKQRPSAEALIRRILRGKNIPSINTAVDAYNLASIETQIPIGAYDYDKIKEPITLRWSKPGEKFKEIGGRIEEIKRQLVISDNEKIINIYPHRDSDETKITEETKNILIIACGAPTVPMRNILEAAEKAAENIVKYCGGRIEEVKAIR